MLQKVINKVRVLGHGALSTKRGDQYKPVRVGLELLNIANELSGRPFCSQEELEKAARDRAAPPVYKASTQREAAPVMVYFDGRDHRTLTKVEELLKGRSIKYQVLDVSSDNATRSWAATQAKIEEFPLVFIAGEAIGGLLELTQLDINGTLSKRVFG
jgi:glutaredoxin